LNASEPCVRPSSGVEWRKHDEITVKKQWGCRQSPVGQRIIPAIFLAYF
jgi:hypothetical protein